MISIFTNIVIIRGCLKKIKNFQNFYFMQHQNNYSKLRYSNSVYNKAGRRGYQKASKVPVGASKFYSKIREFCFKIYFELFFWEN